MPSIIQRSFAGGYISTALYGRADQAKYAAGLKTCENCVIQRFGGVENRAGTNYIQSTKGDGTARLLKFIFNDSQTYVIELGAGYMRFYQNEAPLTVSSAPAWVGANAYSQGDLVTYGGVFYWSITGQSGGGAGFQPDISPGNWYALSGGIFEIPTTYTAGEVFDVQTSQSADVMNFTHQAHAPNELKRFGQTQWTFSAKSFAPAISPPSSITNSNVAPGISPPTAPANSGAAGSTTRWVITSVASGLIIESVASAITQTSATPSGGSPITVSWVAAAGAVEYKVYKYDGSVYGLIGAAVGLSFVDNGMTPNSALNPPVAVPPGTTTQWAVTAVKSATLEESLASAMTGTSAIPTSGSPVTVSWSSVTGASEYNIYKLQNGVLGFIGTAGGLSFVDTGISPDTSDTPPTYPIPLFAGAGAYPAISTYYQQRLVFADTIAEPQSVWMSRAGAYSNFTIRSPLQDDDSIKFTVVGKQVNAIRSLIDIGRLILMTSGSQYAANGDVDGAITPTTINLQQQSNRGVTSIQPILIDNTILFIQARGSLVRDIRYDQTTEGFTGRDLTVFAPDLFDGHTFVSWDYQEIPDSVIWLVRDDGVLLGLTYMREQEVWAWHVHTTDGFVESVTTIPEGGIDYLYMVVRRVINGATKRYVERLQNRNFTDIRYDAVFTDASKLYDGRNLTGTTMTLTGGSTWLAGENLTLTASAGFFTAGDIGNAIVYRSADILGTDDRDLILTITGYTNTTAVTVQPNIPVVAGLRGTPQTLWNRAVDDLSGLSHLEGKTVSILADGNSLTPAVVTGGAITLAKPHSVVRVGLPVTATIELLDIENLQNETLSNKRIDVKEVTLQVQRTRGIEFGPDAEHLIEWKQRKDENWNTPVDLYTGRLTQGVVGKWTDGGALMIRQTEPLPMNILTVVRTGEIGR